MEADEVLSLRRAMRDLVALTTLPAIWSGVQPHDIAESLSDVLLRTLRLDLVYVCLSRLPNGVPLELVRTERELLKGQSAQEIGKTFAPWLTLDAVNSDISLPDPLLQDATLQIASIPIGYEGADGFIIAGGRGTKSLTELDRLVLGVAANQAVTALRQAQLLQDLQSANQLKDALLAKEQTARVEAQRITQQITHLQELTSKLSQSLTVAEVAKVILEMGIKLFGGNRGSVYAVSEDGQSVRRLANFKIELPSLMRYEQIPLTVSTPLTDAVRTRSIVWIGSQGEYLDRYPELAQMTRKNKLQSVAVVPFLSNDQVLGCLGLAFKSPRQFSEEDAHLLEAVAQQCVQGWERARLSEQARISAASEERQRLARDLHDAVSQILFSAAMISEALPRMWERDPEQAIEQLRQVAVLNRAAMAEMRTLLLELRPDTLISTGLNQLVTHLVEAAKGRRNIETQMVVEGNEQFLPGDIRVALYRIVQESINNIIKHGDATHLWVKLQHEPNKISVKINDNGRGFDTQQAHPGLGLRSMRERAELISAVFQITSHIGQGTEISVSWQKPEYYG